MKITAIETIIIRGAGTPPARQWPVHLVHTDDGISGIGRGGNRNVIDNSLAALYLTSNAFQASVASGTGDELIWQHVDAGEATDVATGSGLTVFTPFSDSVSRPTATASTTRL